MSRFLGLGKLTEKQKKALDALRDLLAEEGDDSVTRIYAEAIAEYREQAYVKTNQLKEYKGFATCLCRLAGKRCTRYTPSADCVGFDGIDHRSTYNRNGKPFVFISQPYHLDVEDMRSIVKMADTYGLDVRVDADSWYFPGGSLLVEVHRKDRFQEENREQ